MALGVPEGGIDILPEKNFLLEVNFEELNGVSFSKGCYVGQELTARTKFRAKIKKKLFAFTFDGEINPGSSITLNGKEIATVTSFAKPHGLALTRLAEWKELGIASTDLEPSGIQLFKPEYVTLPETVD
ncbi:CAF17-like 4Fe-4S cluster assembly/insertion protein YgfZ [Sneathiella glossodoripedis]|uniref:CAF17-like 4Fe-4S cluster assembly/insertion protein YgfZ n=1 Tax=Sneathiella glossodoripedis TaxID=418853 RepID=UPI000684987C